MSFDPKVFTWLWRSGLTEASEFEFLCFSSLQPFFSLSTFSFCIFCIFTQHCTLCERNERKNSTSINLYIYMCFWPLYQVCMAAFVSASFAILLIYLCIFCFICLRDENNYTICCQRCAKMTKSNINNGIFIEFVSIKLVIIRMWAYFLFMPIRQTVDIQS